MTVRFVSLQDFCDLQFCSIPRFKRQSVLVGYEISMMVGFGGLGDLTDGQICWVMRFQ